MRIVRNVGSGTSCHGAVISVGYESPSRVEGEGRFLSFHCFTNYVKVAFFRGASLRPVPPGESKSQDTRYLDIHEDDQLDEAQLSAWVK